MKTISSTLCAPTPVCRSVRSGFSLLEVLIALAIFWVAAVALSHAMTQYTEHALEAKLRQQAAFLCQAKMAELAVGYVPLKSTNEATFPDESGTGWQWAAVCTPADVPDLWDVEVRVYRSRFDGSLLQVTLKQFLLDPSLRGNPQDVPQPTMPE